MGFTKLDEGILKSSIMTEPAVTFKLWIALLASCGPDGIAKVSSTFLSSVCHLSLAATDRAIETLANPDPRSRSLTDEGRRIRRVDGGYFLINYEKYRAFTANEGNPNSPGALRTRRWREKNTQNVTGSPVVTGGDVTSVTSASASASVYKREKSVERRGIQLVLDKSPKRWEGITDEDKTLWAKTYPGCNIDNILQEMIAYWDAQPKSKFKINWKRTIVNRLKWIQDHQSNGNYSSVRTESPDEFRSRQKKIDEENRRRYGIPEP